MYEYLDWFERLKFFFVVLKNYVCIEEKSLWLNVFLLSGHHVVLIFPPVQLS